MPAAARAEVLDALARRIAATVRPHPVRVAIDGPDAAGKTILADELAPLVEALGRAVIRASIDGFHRPRAERYARGPDSPEGYYLDSFDYGALRTALLEPLGPDGDRRYRTATFDFRRDGPVQSAAQIAPVDAVLLFDGVFLLRPELRDCWEVTILVTAPPSETIRRAEARDGDLFGDRETIRRRYAARYLPGQDLYVSCVRPAEIADIVIDNSDPTHPRVRKRPTGAAGGGRTGRSRASRPDGAHTTDTSSGRTR